MLNLHTGFICHAGENLFEQCCIRPRCKITQRALAKQDTAAVFQLDPRLNLALNPFQPGVYGKTISVQPRSPLHI